MALQKVFTQSYTEELRNHICPESYKCNEFVYDHNQVKNLMNVRHPEHLADYMVEHADNDFECAIALYEAYKSISPVFAQEDRLWTYLSHVDLFRYLQKRWPITNELENKESFIQDHWFRGNKSMMRTALKGLWWAVYCTIDEKRENKYELTKVLFSNYSFRTMYFGASSLFWYSEATKGIIQFLIDNPDIVDNNFHYRCQFISKYFNQLGGVKALATLDNSFFYNECNRVKEKILKVKTRVDVQNRNVMDDIQYKD